MEVVSKMSTERSKRIDHEVKEIHSQIKKSNLVLRQRMKDIQAEMTEWTLGEENGESEGITE
jgi:hypothetical protein